MINFIIPVLNEVETIIDTLESIKNDIPESIKRRIYIVYDFEGDPTIPIIKKSEKNYDFPLIIMKNKFGRGAANAIRTGFDMIKIGYTVVTMADLSDDYSLIGRMIQMTDRGYDIVCASRYTGCGEKAGLAGIKAMLSRLAGLSLFYLFGIPTKDATNSYKLYKREVLEAVRIESRHGFEIGLEIVVKAFRMGYRIGEVPAVLRQRKKGKSKFRLLKWLPYYIKWYIYAILTRFLHRKDRKRD